MTTTVVIDASTAPESRAAAGSRQASTVSAASPRPTTHELTFTGVLRSERIKLLSLRSIRVTLGITVVLGLAFSTLMAIVWNIEMGDAAATFDAVAVQAYLLMSATFAAPFLALVFGVLGVFASASEYTSGMVLSSLSAVPRRGMLFVGKALVTVIVAGIAAMLLLLGGLAIAVWVLPTSAAEVVSPSVISGVLGTAFYLVATALLGFGVAFLLRSTAGGVAVVAGLMFVLPIVFQLLTMTEWAWVPTAAAYLPGNLVTSLSQGLDAADPSFVAAGLAMLLWVAAAVVPANATLLRRDAR